MDYPDLPLIAGEGAVKILRHALLASATPCGSVARFDLCGRDWDLVDRNQRIMLPAEGAVQAEKF